MRGSSVSRSLGLVCAAGALVALAGVGAAQAAADEVLDGCRGECGEAVHVCRLAHKAAWRVCRDECGPGKSCRRECDRAFARARRVCRDERRECRQACLPPADPECVLACGDDFAGYREDLGACKDECRSQLEAALTQCRELVSDTCDPEAFKECVHQARVDGRACGESCHDDLPCAAGLRECLWSCREVDAP
jgi:hypothetical protein